MYEWGVLNGRGCVVEARRHLFKYWGPCCAHRFNLCRPVVAITYEFPRSFIGDKCTSLDTTTGDGDRPRPPENLGPVPGHSHGKYVRRRAQARELQLFTTALDIWLETTQTATIDIALLPASDTQDFIFGPIYTHVAIIVSPKN